MYESVRVWNKDMEVRQNMLCAASQLLCRINHQAASPETTHSINPSCSQLAITLLYGHVSLEESSTEQRCG